MHEVSVIIVVSICCLFSGEINSLALLHSPRLRRNPQAAFGSGKSFGGTKIFKSDARGLQGLNPSGETEA